MLCFCTINYYYYHHHYNHQYCFVTELIGCCTLKVLCIYSYYASKISVSLKWVGFLKHHMLPILLVLTHLFYKAQSPEISLHNFIACLPESLFSTFFIHIKQFCNSLYDCLVYTYHIPIPVQLSLLHTTHHSLDTQCFFQYICTSLFVLTDIAHLLASFLPRLHICFALTAHVSLWYKIALHTTCLSHWEVFCYLCELFQLVHILASILLEHPHPLLTKLQR